MANDNANDPQRVWDLAKKIGVAMIASWDGSKPHSRPMSAHVDQKDNAFYFLTDKTDKKTQDLKQYPSVCMAFGDASDMKYVSVTGDASVSDDRAKIKELWSVWAKAWWDSPDDPNIVVLKVVPTQAEYWDTPGKIVATVKMAVAAATNTRPQIGDMGKVAM
jgi:general stress protein 26